MADWLVPPWPLWLNVVLFLVGAGIVANLGPRLVGVVQTLGERYDLGQALTGAILLGVSTSLPGITAVATAGLGNNADLAVSTCFGGIIAQTSFLVVADLLHPRRNLEADVHASGVMMSGTLLIGLIGLAVLAIVGPEWPMWHIHPASLLLPAVYLIGVKIIDRTKDEPGWRTERAPEEEVEGAEVEEAGLDEVSTGRLLVRYLGLALVVAATGWLLARTGDAVGSALHLNDSVAGSLLIGQATSLPELVTVIAAVRLPAPALAVSNIIGGNAFDVLFLTVGDVTYREGSIYHAVANQSTFLGVMGILATAALVMGLIHRKKAAILNIGFEQAAIFIIYVGGFGILLVW